MESPTREETDHLIARLSKAPFEFNFYRAIRLLESYYRDEPKIGTSLRFKDDWVRFGQHPSLKCAPATIDEFKKSGSTPAQMFVQFFGLLGPNGALPRHITDHALDQLAKKDPTLPRFLDLFHHRFVSLFYRAWASAQKSVDFDRPEESRFATYIGSLFGLGMQSLLGRDAVPDRAKLYYSGRLVCQSRNAEGLHAILEDFFKIPTKIEEFCGFWMRVPEASRCRLGESPDTGLLGLNVITGSRKYETQLKFRIRMGPMTKADFERLLPGGGAFERLKAWVLNYIGHELWWDVQCVILAAEVPPTHLGVAGGRLGLSCWLKSAEFTRDAEDSIFDPENFS